MTIEVALAKYMPELVSPPRKLSARLSLNNTQRLQVPFRASKINLGSDKNVEAKSKRPDICCIAGNLSINSCSVHAERVTVVTRRAALTAVYSVISVASQNASVPVAQAVTFHSRLQPSLRSEWVVFDQGSSLVIRNDGTLILQGPDPSSSPQLFSITLPLSAPILCSPLPVDMAPPGSLLALEWSHTTLVIWAASSYANVHSFKTWSPSSTGGFVLEVTVPSSVPVSGSLKGIPTAAAELTADLASGGSWYGGAHLLRQLWPLDRSVWEVGPLYPFDHGPNGLGSVVGNHWVSSQGTLIVVDPTTDKLFFGLNSPREPFHRAYSRYFGVGIQHITQKTLPIEDTRNNSVDSLGDGKLRLQARASWDDLTMVHPWQQIDFSDQTGMQPGALNVEGLQHRGIVPLTETACGQCVLRVFVAACSDVREATLAAFRPLPNPALPPPAIVLERPVWTTWATTHADVNEEQVIALGKDVVEYGFTPGVLEIDDRWQSKYGDLEFDPKKFPSPKAMVNQLHDLGFLVTVWVMPFLQEGSSSCLEARALGYLVEGGDPPTLIEEMRVGGTSGRLGTAMKIIIDQCDWPPGHRKGGGGGGILQSGQFRWWGTQPVRAIDLTNDQAVDWFVRRLKWLQFRVGVDGFKFDAGEPCFLPRGAVMRRPLRYPGEYTQLWVNKVASCFPLSEVRSAFGTTGYAGLLRMGDRDTLWGAENGLQSLIPALLTSAVLGYPFCLPDMIGGNAYWGQFPDTELMVRWAQVSMFMPAVQWSIPPWKVSKLAFDACKIAESARMQVYLPRAGPLIGMAVADLVPICRPLWWLDPKDEETFLIDDQFAVGNDVIVAPVVRKGDRQRRLYLPVGRWTEWQPEIPIEGKLDSGVCLEDTLSRTGPCWITVDAPLQKIPIFILVK